MDLIVEEMAAQRASDGEKTVPVDELDELSRMFSQGSHREPLRN